MDSSDPGAGQAVSFDCSICGEWAMSLILPTAESPMSETQPVPRGPDWLEVRSGLGSVHLRVTEEGAAPDPDFLDRARILAAFEDGGPDAFHALESGARTELVPNLRSDLLH